MSKIWKGAAIAICVVVGAWLILRQPGLKPPTTKLDPGELVRVVSRGERVSLADHVSPTGWTIVEFTADW